MSKEGFGSPSRCILKIIIPNSEESRKLKEKEKSDSEKKEVRKTLTLKK